MVDCYKAFGYEIMDIRFGGLKQKITNCKKHISSMYPVKFKIFLS